MRKLVTLILLVAVVAMSGACSVRSVPRATFSDDGDYLPPPSGPGLVAQAQSPIPDVPLPIGFVPVPSRSESHFDGQTRQVRHVYQGRGNIAEVVNFYRQQLPRHDWDSQGRERDPDGTTVMRFSKGRESLHIRVSERHSVLTTAVTIGPRM